MFKVPLIEDLPLSGTEIKEFLIQVAGLYFDGDTEGAQHLFYELVLVHTNDERRIYSSVHEFETYEQAAAKLAQVELLEIIVLYNMTILEELMCNDTLDPEERIAHGLTDMLVSIIDLPQMLHEKIDHETLMMHEANDGA